MEEARKGSNLGWQGEAEVDSGGGWRQKCEGGVKAPTRHMFDLQDQIRFILLQNRQGKTRLAKYYVPFEESEKHRVEYEVHRLVVNRDPKFTNFVEFRTHKVIYRRYAGLFFSMCVDITDNELAYLECIHLFVEILDHFFSNVCELDLVFNFHKVYLILDEFILAGELQETSKKEDFSASSTTDINFQKAITARRIMGKADARNTGW
ncbi:AP-2 complex subunit sigma [Acorus gramineus]|uniref:AP-2 complex subunit sigma n=1 Tax=Acorus gramineus TaxID=55184 RepID=A0AAV9BAR8_ACOGR|nr:AP-2 complex subunit sigma [Acorus gramineus]